MRKSRNERDSIALEDLEDLISLAEKVSTNVQQLKAKSFAESGKSFAYTLFLIFSFVLTASLVNYATDGLEFNKGVDMLSGFGAVATFVAMNFFLYLLASMQRNSKRLDEEIQTESQILVDLLKMIHPLKESVSGRELGHVSEAILDMRLKRIKFSTEAKTDPSKDKVQDLSISTQEIG